ncbi:MAG: tryptophan--tRNA ligase [Treponema sp. GWB1_62_6]|nr:MAG: tryptophan--tRNA ligase [Treponema sp. GWA1_62_8]OHE69499.1 MAG: tryptophan--tRNA ligase [Treponema sp. GWC1_61_84]OHE72438.1 MAG: tryptophan--tRNA ligase [Treponema sp. GWB1_62_6]OHE74929.1 MAG: tryptophan--tRNA ligase [Treponema sp. RIFOXYC1_FULL_61_9]HCM24959.1 tryptophan--tRNA ligase [Treponema sp.]
MAETKNEGNGKPVIFSGIQPSGNLTIGNYIGALKNFDQFQNDYECYYCVVDLHSITVRQDAARLRKRTVELTALYMAVGLDPERSTLYVQSHVSAHAELAWILNCYSYMGEMSRMTQFKDKSRKNEENINVGLFTYPVLMAADILLYQTNLVPIGEDQRQHLEICRDIAIRFNNAYSPTFAVPEAYIPKVGARVMSLQEPTSKMSKSDENADNFVAILDPQDVVMRKFKRAVTDSETEVRYDVQAKPGITNLMSIYGAMTGKDMPAIEKEFAGRGYGDFKEAVGVSVAEGLRPVREKYAALVADAPAIEAMLGRCAGRAEQVARKTLTKVQRKVGFLPRPRSM